MNILHFAIIVTLSLVSTYILFRYLNATASGEGRFLNGTVKYGGSLAGFVVVSLVLFGGYKAIFKEKPTERVGNSIIKPTSTEIDINGRWLLEFREPSVDNIRNLYPTGSVCIRQEDQSTAFIISGDIYEDGQRSAKNLATFRSEVGKINGNRATFRYSMTSNGGVTGEANIVITNDVPKMLLVDYRDDNDISPPIGGQFTLTKTSSSC